MAYDSYKRSQLNTLRKKVADFAKALDDMAQTMEEMKVETVSLQLREVKKRVAIYMETATDHVNDVREKMEKARGKGEKLEAATEE